MYTIKYIKLKDTNCIEVQLLIHLKIVFAIVYVINIKITNSMNIHYISKYISVIQNTEKIYSSYVMWYENICVFIGDNVTSITNVTVSSIFIVKGNNFG